MVFVKYVVFLSDVVFLLLFLSIFMFFVNLFGFLIILPGFICFCSFVLFFAYIRQSLSAFVIISGVSPRVLDLPTPLRIHELSMGVHRKSSDMHALHSLFLASHLLSMDNHGCRKQFFFCARSQDRYNMWCFLLAPNNHDLRCSQVEKNRLLMSLAGTSLFFTLSAQT